MLKSIFSLLSAITISVIIICFFETNKNKPIETYSETYNPIYSSNNLVLSHLNSSLYYGDKIILMGSSELANDKEEAIPYNFLKNKIKTNVEGYGHAGNQSFSMACQLALLNASLKKSKIVILISPSWFKGKSAKGTSIDCLFDYINEADLNKIYYDDSIPIFFKTEMANYINTNIENLNNPSSIFSLYNLKKLQDENQISKIRYSASYIIENVLHSVELKISNKYKFSVTKFNPTYNTSIDTIYLWDSLFAFGINKEKSMCKNEFAVNDKYFADNNCASNLPLQIDDINYNSKEFSDFNLLIKICVNYKIKPLFVIQPLNPLVYNDLQRLTPLINKLDSIITKNGFTSFNMWTDKKEVYTKGTLTDVMHLGAYGWYKVDKAIFDYFKN